MVSLEIMDYETPSRHPARYDLDSLELEYQTTENYSQSPNQSVPYPKLNFTLNEKLKAKLQQPKPVAEKFRTNTQLEQRNKEITN